MMDIDVQISSVQREIGMRERVYPRWVAQSKLTQAAADHEINAMKQVLKTLQQLRAAPAARLKIGSWTLAAGSKEGKVAVISGDGEVRDLAVTRVAEAITDVWGQT